MTIAKVLLMAPWLICFAKCSHSPNVQASMLTQSCDVFPQLAQPCMITIH